MIFVLETPSGEPPSAWFAHDTADLLRKVAALDIELLRRTHAAGLSDCEPAQLAEATLRARGAARIYWDEAEAMAAFERGADPIWQGDGWRARWALREQLVATEVLADDA